ncbi:unnamed protein product, partial [Diamesa serratosioi]
MENLIQPVFFEKRFTNKSSTVVLEDVDSELYDVSTTVLVLLSIFYGSVSILAVLGNALLIFIVRTTRLMHTVTGFFIANLALADVTIGLFAIPFQFQAAVLQRWVLPDFMCPICPFIQIVSVNVSVFTLTAIAIDRYKAVLHPLQLRSTKNYTKISIIIIWGLSILLALPISYGLRVVYVNRIVLSTHNSTKMRTNIPKAFCQNVNMSYITMLYYRYILVLVQYIIPFCIISYIYFQMALKLWGSKTPGNASDARDVTLLKNKLKVIKMLVIVVILFGICWLPLQTYNILQATFPQINEFKYINIIWFCCDWLAMSNSCYNPFIYGIYNEKFQREFFERFTCFHRLGLRFQKDSNGSIGDTGGHLTMTDYYSEKVAYQYVTKSNT